MLRLDAAETLARRQRAAPAGAGEDAQRPAPAVAAQATGLLIPNLRAPHSISRENDAWIQPALAEARAAGLRIPRQKPGLDGIEAALEALVCPALRTYDDRWSYVHCHQTGGPEKPGVFFITVNPVMEEAFALEPLFNRLGPELTQWAVHLLNRHPKVAGPSVWEWWLDEFGFMPKPKETEDGPPDETEAADDDDSGMPEFVADPKAKSYVGELRKSGFIAAPKQPGLADAEALRRIRRRDRTLGLILERLIAPLQRNDPAAAWRPCKFDEPIAVTYFKPGDPTSHAIDCIMHNLHEGNMEMRQTVADFEGTLPELKRQMDCAEHWFAPVLALEDWCNTHHGD